MQRRTWLGDSIVLYVVSCHELHRGSVKTDAARGLLRLVALLRDSEGASVKEGLPLFEDSTTKVAELRRQQLRGSEVSHLDPSDGAIDDEQAALERVQAVKAGRDHRDIPITTYESVTARAGPEQHESIESYSLLEATPQSLDQSIR